MILHVLQSPNAGLMGIFTTPEYARTAAQNYAEFLGGKWKVDDRGYECIYTHTDGRQMTISRWEADRALIEGKWKILGQEEFNLV